MRVFGKRPLNLAYDTATSSYWVRRAPPGPAPTASPSNSKAVHVVQEDA